MEDIIEEPLILNGESIKILVGPEALDLIANPRFQSCWNSLLQSCPWATIFQSPEFVNEWTNIFHNGNVPILIYSHLNGNLDGLLNMTLSRESGEITGSGKSDAHYHAWITRDYNKEFFIMEALQVLKNKFKNHKILFTNLPSNAPIDWIKSDPTWSNCCDIKLLNRPFIILKHQEVDALLKKKQFRQNINRLKKQGDFRLEKISDINRFIQLLDELAIQYDFRQWATYNRYPFKSNPLKKTFYIRLFHQKILNATVLWMNDQIIGSIVGTVGLKGWVHGAGINTQCPSFSKFSPGFLNFILYAEQLFKAGHEFLDLSTGAFSYKDRLASTSDTVYRLAIYPKPQNSIKKRSSKMVQGFVAKGMDRMNIDPKKIKDPLLKNGLLAKEKLILIKNHGIHTWVRNKVLKIVNNKSHTYTLINEGDVLKVNNGISINLNSIRDFLDFEPDGSLLTKWEFLFDCMRRMEKGELSFSWTSENKLMALIWMQKISEKDGNSTPDPAQKDISILQGLYVHQEGLQVLDQFLSKVKEKVYENNQNQELMVSAHLNLKPYCPNLKIVHL